MASNSDIHPSTSEYRPTLNATFIQTWVNPAYKMNPLHNFQFSWKHLYSHYTGCFTTRGHYCRRWFPMFLWSKKFIQTCVRFWTFTELWAFFNSRTRPRVNRVLRNQLAGDVLSLVAYRLRKLQRATRAVHNRAAACVEAGGGIFENQL